MVKLKHYFYEIISVSLGISIITFFGILSLAPMEIMLLGQEQSFLWVFLFLSYSVILSFILFTRFKQAYTLYIMRIFEIISTIILFFLMVAYLEFSKDMSEPWLIQTGWFLRDNGFITGLFLSTTLIKTTGGLTFLISKFSLKEETINEGESKKNSEFLVLLIIFIALCIFILEFLFYRFVSLFEILVVYAIMGIVLVSLSAFLITRSDNEELIALPIIEYEIKSKEGAITSKNNKEKVSNSIIYLIIAIYGVFTTVILIVHVMIKIMDWALMLEQFLTYAMLLIVFLVLQGSAFRVRSTQRFEDYYKKKRKLFLFGSLDGWRFLGLWLVTSQVIYFFDYPIYFPYVLIWTLIFALIGAFIYWSISKLSANKAPQIRVLLYTIAILSLVINIILVYQDAITNSIFYLGLTHGDLDITFPFLYIFSPINFILVGVPIGIILSDFLLNFAFKHTDGSDSTNRAIFLTFVPFVWGLIIFPINWYLSVPGGVPIFLSPNLLFTIFCILFIIILLTGLAFYFITEVITPRRCEKREKFSIRREISKTFTDTIKLNRKNNRKKVIAGFLIISIGLSSFGGLFLLYKYKEVNSKPLLAYSKGNYYVWLQNSSERVSKNMRIAPDDSPMIDKVEIFTAKNEYEAFQLVWRPIEGAIDSLKYEISDFIHNENPSEIIDANNCSLRYVDYIIEDEFPDVLAPFSSLDLKFDENYVFWISIRTPKSCLSGNYSGQITFNFNDNESVIINILLRVWDFSVPDQRHLRMTVGPYTDDLDLIQNFQDHRVSDYGVRISSTDNISILQSEEKYTCYLDKNTNTWIFNWTWWDDITQYKLNTGMNAFSISYPLGIHEGRIPKIHNDTIVLWMQNFFESAQAHLELKGWLKYSYTHFIDEANQFIPQGYTREKYFSELITLAQKMDEAAPKIKIMATIPPLEEYKELEDYIDIFCPTTPFHDQAKWDEILDEGKEFWIYYCIGPNSPYPNSHLYNRLYEPRVIIWQVWYYKIHGYLYWHSKGYTHGRYGFGFNGYGDGWFIYERNDKLLDSTRWESYLDGLEDYEYIWLLNATFNYLEENSGILSTQKIDSYRFELTNIVSSITGEKWTYCDHPSVIYNARIRLGNILNDLGKIVNLETIGEAPWVPPDSN